MWLGTAFTFPATVYLALLKTNPTVDDGTGLVEVVVADWTGYTRTSDASANWTGPTGTASPQQISNSATISPAGSAAATITITGFALYDAATAGNFLGWGTIASGAVTSGTSVSFPAGQLVVQD